MNLVSREPMKFINRKILFFFSFLLLAPLLIVFPKSALAATHNLTGTVTTSIGNPLASASVDVINSTTLANVGSTTTDSNGNYSIQVDDGTYNVSVTPPGGSGFTSAVALSQNISADKILNFVLVPAGQVTFSGRVLDANGNPVPNQLVALEGSGQSTTTNATGNFFLTVSSGVYQINITKSNNPTSLNVPQNYRIFKNGFSLTQSKMFDITLPLKQVIMHVQDNASNPVGNVGVMAAVHLVNHGAEANVGGLSIGGGITDASGYAEYGTFSSIAPKTDPLSGNVTLWLFPNNGSRMYNFKSMPPSGSGFLDTQLNNIAITSDTGLTTTLFQPVTLSGIVRDGQGNPVPNQLVSLEGSGQSTTTNATGSYSLTVAPGLYTLVVTKSNNPLSLNVPQNYRIFKSNYAITQSTTLNIDLPLKQVVLNVEDVFSNPISNVSIRVGAHPTNQGIEINVGGLTIADGITDASGYAEYGTISSTAPQTESGNITLWLLPNNGTRRYTITGTPPSGSPYQSTSLTNIAISANTSLTMTLQQPVTLTGHVYDSLNNPVPNQLVSLDNSGQSSLTDASGAYTLNVSAGTYTLNITKTNNLLSLNVPQNYRIYKNNFTIAQNTVLEITIPVRQILVHVQDQNNNPIQTIGIRAGAHLINSAIEGNLGGLTIADTINDASGYSEYGTLGSQAPTTDVSGDRTLWLLPNNGGRTYQFTATPPSGSIYNPFNLTGIPVTQDQTEIISLQFNHAAPVTTALLLPDPISQGYLDPTTVEFSATADTGYIVANTFFKVDGGSQQTYTSPFTVSGVGEHTIEYWSVDNSGVAEAPKTTTITIVATYDISGVVYRDDNQNGLQDEGENGYEGAEITLSSGQTTTTDNNGNYSHSNLVAGTYTETLSVPSGYIATTANPVEVALSADTIQNFGITIAPTATPTPTNTPTPTPTPTDTPTPTPTDTPTPTPIPTYKLTGVVFNDSNSNGFQDEGETGFSGAVVSLDTGENTTTDTEGEYIFSGLFAGTYIDTLTVPVGYVATTTNPVTVPVSSDTTVNFGITLAPTNTPTPTSTPTPTPVNVAPIVESVTPSGTTISINNSIIFTGVFTDANPTDTHTATWNWGDGSTSTGTVSESNGSGTVVDAHTYSTTGVYTVTLTVSDNSNASGSFEYQYITIYDPSNGWATGDKEYSSPVGSVLSNPSITGSADFGFTARYVNGVLLPVGNKWASVSFPAGNIEFTASTYQSLVIVNNKITLRGIGTLNNAGGYSLLVSAIDGGPQGTSFVRYQIKNSLGAVIYDTQPGASDTANPTTAVTKGKIQIH